MRLPRRRTLWLSAALVLAVVVGVSWWLVARSRITQENFERIQNGMTYDEVTGILGKPTPLLGSGHVSGTWDEGWGDGPSDIIVEFKTSNGKVVATKLHLATVSETLIWYSKKGAKKIGVKWD